MGGGTTHCGGKCRESRLEGDDQFCLGHRKFEGLLGHSAREGQKAVGQVGLELQ